jgi:DNA replication and repair protein RecF
MQLSKSNNTFAAYMHLQLTHLRLYNFKNYSSSKFEFSPEINCFTGLNGSGKTNVLDAIYYLCFTKSYFQNQDVVNILINQNELSINGTFIKNNNTENVQLIIQKESKKKLKLNNNEYTKLADHIGLFPLVIIAPNDIYLIHEGSEERRKFIDSFIAQFDKIYLTNLIQYNRALEQRNACLKSFFETHYFDENLINNYNEKLILHGSYIFEKRKEFIADFEPLFLKYYIKISSNSDSVSLKYESELYNENFSNLLVNNIKNDQAAQRTTKGIHKDDLIFEINNFPLKKMGSQGQQKSFIIALKLAQYEYLKNKTSIKPLLLLDDIFEKLDNNRLAIILNMIGEDNFGQIFISDTDKKRLEEMFKNLQAKIKYFEINNGTLVAST